MAAAELPLGALVAVLCWERKREQSSRTPKGLADLDGGFGGAYVVEAVVGADGYGVFAGS
jgi:hypothetical protein